MIMKRRSPHADDEDALSPLVSSEAPPYDGEDKEKRAHPRHELHVLVVQVQLLGGPLEALRL